MRKRLTIGRLAVREMQRSKVNTLLCLAVVAVATGMFTAMAAIGLASMDATRILMKEMGFNLLIVPKSVDPARYQALDFQDADLPEEYVGRLASSAGVMAQHFVGKYQKTIPIEGCTMVLTGVVAETLRKGTDKQPMPTAYGVQEGEVYLGSAAAKALGKEAGQALEIMGKSFEIGKILPEVGVMPEDIRVYAHLHDVQALLGKPGRINAIDALACQCPVEVKDIVAALRRNIESILPDVTVQPYHSILLARYQQRSMMDRLGLVALALAVAGAAAAIWGLTHQNVTNRRYEIGVLRALGVPDWRIAALFVVKILSYGVAGAALGCAGGGALARWLNPAPAPVVIPTSLIEMVLLVTPLATLLFALPPIVGRLLQEPIDVLGEGES